jgi:transcriptional regulator with XRE-family HTH domain
MAYQKVLFERDILKQARENLGLTQQEVADKAKIHHRQYQRFERGERNLSSSSFNIACRVLEVLQLDIVRYAHGDYVFSEETVDFPFHNPAEGKEQ